MKITDLEVGRIYKATCARRGIPVSIFYGEYAGLLPHPDFESMPVHTFCIGRPSYGKPTMLHLSFLFTTPYDFTELIPIEDVPITVPAIERTYLNCDCIGCQLYREENNLPKE